MDCTGESLCDLCEIDKITKEWLSDCCDYPFMGVLSFVSSSSASGFCGKCFDYTLFSKYE